MKSIALSGVPHRHSVHPNCKRSSAHITHRLPIRSRIVSWSRLGQVSNSTIKPVNPDKIETCSAFIVPMSVCFGGDLIVAAKDSIFITRPAFRARRRRKICALAGYAHRPNRVGRIQGFGQSALRGGNRSDDRRAADSRPDGRHDQAVEQAGQERRR
jgi:hypothetical protein